MRTLRKGEHLQIKTYMGESLPTLCHYVTIVGMDSLFDIIVTIVICIRPNINLYTFILCFVTYRRIILLSYTMLYVRTQLKCQGQN